jgi:hypothetical protein
MKSLFASKTFWFNIITIALGIIQVISKTYPIPTETLALIIGIGNILLRIFTGEPVTVGGKVLFRGKK